MASMQFQIHADKENASRSASHKLHSGSIKSGKAKTFQALKTPRRVLGSVNEASRVGGQPPLGRNGDTVSALKKGNVASEKDIKLKQRPLLDKENDVAKSGKQKEEKNVTHLSEKPRQQQPSSYCLPEIEYMPPPSPPRDEDEDILPMTERASTYVHKLLSWRPHCLFGVEPDSEEEDEKERRRIMAELDILPLPQDDLFPPADLHLSCEELDLDSIELPNMDDIQLPFIDDDDDEVACDTEEGLSLSTLDDSLGLSHHLGSLQLRDESLPSTPSH